MEARFERLVLQPRRYPARSRSTERSTCAARSSAVLTPRRTRARAPPGQRRRSNGRGGGAKAHTMTPVCMSCAAGSDKQRCITDDTGARFNQLTQLYIVHGLDVLPGFIEK